LFTNCGASVGSQLSLSTGALDAVDVVYYDRPLRSDMRGQDRRLTFLPGGRMSSPSSDDNPRLSDAEVQRILQRAVEIDTRSLQSLGLADVRRIAEEVGMSASAVDQAYRELRDGVLDTPPHPSALKRIVQRVGGRTLGSAAVVVAAALAGLIVLRYLLP
jgi:hypothetical protein